VRPLVRVHPDHDHAPVPSLDMADEADPGGHHSVGLWQAPIKSRRRSSVGDGRHSESRSDPHESTVAKRASPPPPENPTSPAGHHRSDQPPLTEWRSSGLPGSVTAPASLRKQLLAARARTWYCDRWPRDVVAAQPGSGRSVAPPPTRTA
jgi:hypothetical protein